MGFLYEFLQKFGFEHPLHPVLVHMPIGLIIGAFVFILVAMIYKREGYLTTAFRCIVLSLIFLVPAVFAGVTDWLFFFSGVWSFSIKIKVTLTVILVLLLGAAIVMEMRKIGGTLGRAIVYFLCVMAVSGAGYFGAELVYPGRGLAVNDMQLQAGEKLYTAHCASCHPRGGNILDREKPVIGSAYLKEPGVFTTFNRKPLRPDGSEGLMPAFPEDKISDREMTLIYRYVIEVMSADQIKDRRG